VTIKSVTEWLLGDRLQHTPNNLCYPVQLAHSQQEGLQHTMAMPSHHYHSSTLHAAACTLGLLLLAALAAPRATAARAPAVLLVSAQQTGSQQANTGMLAGSMRALLWVPASIYAAGDWEAA
jgi:hypothetical protein